jgi:exonuclease SbcC
MKIEIVQLQNIRSHEKSTVPFAKGFNCLVGGLGCGKSSILYAIDFALFGDPTGGRSFDYLLREGASSGRVVLQFVQNGKTYKLCRSLRRRGKGINQDPDELKLFEDETVIASMKGDAVAEQIKIITGLDKELFREIVWVRQEHLKELLDATPRDRQNRLDGLFGLSDYNIAWSNIAIYQRDYETEKKVYEKDPDVVGMGKLSSEYDGVVEEFSKIEIVLEETGRKFDAARKELDEANLNLEKLEKIKMQAEELRRKEAQTLANLANLESTLKSLPEKINAKKTNIEDFEERLSNLEKQVDLSKTELRQVGVSPDQPLETLRQYLDTFANQIANLKGEQEATSRTLRENQKRNSQLSTESRCPLCLQQLSDDYKTALMQRILDENSAGQKEITRLQREIEELQQLKNKANAAFSNFQTAIPRVNDLKTRINEESQTLADLSAEFDEKGKLEADVREQLEAIRSEISIFDSSELEAAKTYREQMLEQYHSLNYELQSNENHKRDLVKRLDEIKERIDLAQQKIERMHKIVKIAEVIDGIRDAYRGIQPKLRSEFVKVLRSFVQQVLDSLVGSEGPLLNVLIDENYTPYVSSESGAEREASCLSGGERTLLAFAYRLGLGQLIMQSRTGHGLSMLMLDEPTESLGREDGSIDRLAEAISRFKAVEQIIAVTHSEAFAEKAEHVIRLGKEAGVSKVSVER